MNITYKKQKDFGEFDWKSLSEGEYATNGDNFSFGKGGPSGPGWHITTFTGEHHTDNYIEITWELPGVLSRMFDWQMETGQKDK